MLKESDTKSDTKAYLICIFGIDVQRSAERRRQQVLSKRGAAIAEDIVRHY